MKKDTYCGMCGLKLIKKIVFGYDTKTGEKNVVFLCPTENCNHYGIRHRYISERHGFFSASNVLSRCNKCGDTNCDNM